MKCLSRSSSGAKLVARNVAPTVCVPAVVLKRTRIGVPPRPPKNASGPAWPPRTARGCGVRPGPQLAGGLRPPPCQSIELTAARRRAASRCRSHGTEPKPVGDMLSPKIGVTVSVYSPSDGNDVRHQQAAARAERQPFDVVVLRRVLARAVDDQRRLFGIADRQPADLLRRRHVRLDQRGRNAERAGDVVEAGRGVVRRQVLRRVDVEVEQVADDVRVFGAVQAVQSGRRRERRRRRDRARSRTSAIIASKAAGSGRFMPAGGIMPARSLRTTSSHVLASCVDVGRIERVERQLARRVHARGLGALAVAGHAGTA